MDEISHLNTQLVDASAQLTDSRLELESQRKMLHILQREVASNRLQSQKTQDRLVSIRDDISAAKQLLRDTEVKLAVAKQRTIVYKAHLNAVEAVGERLMNMFKRRSLNLRRCASTLIPQENEDQQYRNLDTLSQMIKEKRREKQIKRERETMKLKAEKQFLLSQRIEVNKQIALLKRRTVGKHY